MKLILGLCFPILVVTVLVTVSAHRYEIPTPKALMRAFDTYMFARKNNKVELARMIDLRTDLDEILYDLKDNRTARRYFIDYLIETLEFGDILDEDKYEALDTVEDLAGIFFDTDVPTIKILFTDMFKLFFEGKHLHSKNICRHMTVAQCTNHYQRPSPGELVKAFDYYMVYRGNDYEELFNLMHMRINIVDIVRKLKENGDLLNDFVEYLWETLEFADMYEELKMRGMEIFARMHEYIENETDQAEIVRLFTEAFRLFFQGERLQSRDICLHLTKEECTDIFSL